MTPVCSLPLLCTVIFWSLWNSSDDKNHRYLLLILWVCVFVCISLTSPTELERAWTIFSCAVATTLCPLISMILWPTRTPPRSAIPPLIRLHIWWESTESELTKSSVRPVEIVYIITFKEKLLAHFSRCVNIVWVETAVYHSTDTVFPQCFQCRGNKIMSTLIFTETGRWNMHMQDGTNTRYIQHWTAIFCFCVLISE